MGFIQNNGWRLGIALAAMSVARAEVPPDIAKQLIEIGRGVCVPETAQIYRPLHPNPPYSGMSIQRDISFGPDPKNVLDVFSPEKGGGSLPVLIYVSGGAGNKQQGGPNGDVFYDNIMLWAVKNGMVGVNMQRRPGETWDDPAKDIGRVVQWVNQNIARYKGNPARVFIWCQSAGNVPVSTYVGHPELYGPEGVGVKGVVFMSPPAFNILPATPPAVQGGFAPCGQPGGGTSANAAPGGGRGPGGAGRGAKQGQPDAATLLARSNLPGLVNSKLPFMLSVAELDPPNIIAFAETFRDELCKAGRCPTYVTFKAHSHISEVMSPDTADTSVTGPILAWMKSVK
ncbi:MAG: carboxylesterase family protein [Acidobacteriia bacterium]|nr:carboxylesterase family protein [Terriglobia bacterium]